MYLEHKTSGNAVEILDLSALFDPYQSKVSGRFHAGEEMQEAEDFAKSELGFLSGESLPRCWWDAQYRAANRRTA